MANQFPEWPDRDGQPDRNASPDRDAVRRDDESYRSGGAQYQPPEYGSPQYSAPQYAEGTYDRLNFQNPGQTPEYPTSGRASVPVHPAEREWHQPPVHPGAAPPAPPRSAPGYPDPGYPEPGRAGSGYAGSGHTGAGHPGYPGHAGHGAELRDDELVHSHTHSAATPVSARTRKAVIAILVPAILATVVGLIWLWPGQIHYGNSTGDSGQQQRSAGTVSGVVEQSCPDTDEAEAAGLTGPCGTATVKVTDGVGKGQTVTIELPQGPGAPVVHADDKVVLVVLSGGDGDSTARYTIVDKQRSGSLWLLVALAAVVVIGFGRLRGLAAIGGLVVSFAVLLLFVLPGILGGSPPLLVAVVGSSTIMFAVLYLTHGVSVRTSVAILGTLASLVLTGLLGAGFTALTELTGLGDEQSVYLATVEGGVDMRGLLLAGIIIGSLGVLDDVTITQAEVVSELARAPRSRFDLYRAAIRVGRAHVGSAVNTIVLAYAGASLPLLLLISVSGQSLGSLVTGQSLAQEIVRALVGTIGLVASVPITTALAALVAEPPAEDEEPAGTPA
ncbi:YibE/F family protein [Cryptosporangium japonicum]|uniref:YibE/F family protein n=1 Tax=Cryptosporangium japonicum TaxID=80872 RepID=A0ABN0VA56_9ACTN